MRAGKLLLIIISLLAACGAPASHDESAVRPSPSRIGVTIAGRTPAVDMSRSGACPTLKRHHWRDVSNTWSGAAERLVPGANSPAAAVICIFGSAHCPCPQRTLVTPIRIGLGTNYAARLARVVASIQLGDIPGAHLCGTVTNAFALIELSYHDIPPVSLYYAAGGCRTLDNGHVCAYQLTNPTFARFQATLSAVTHGKLY